VSKRKIGLFRVEIELLWVFDYSVNLRGLGVNLRILNDLRKSNYCRSAAKIRVDVGSIVLYIYNVQLMDSVRRGNAIGILPASKAEMK
jgi:hypothetical protein